MKKSVQILSFLWMVFFAANTMMAGNETATIDEHLQIVIPADKLLADSYTIDISQLKFKDAQMADQFFGSYADAGVNFKVDFLNNIVTMTIHGIGASTDWTPTDWNKYFVNRSKKMEVYYNILQGRN